MALLKLTSLPLLLLVCSLCMGCSAPPPPATTPTASTNDPTKSAVSLFEQCWSDFEQNYPYFAHKGVDWKAVKAQYAPQFAAEMTPDAFADKLAEMLNVLHDWHVHVTRPDGTIKGYNSEYPINYTGVPRNRYATQNYLRLGKAIWHGWLNGNIAYIRVDSLLRKDFSGVGDAEIDGLFKTYAGARGFILDLRPNNGGDEKLAMAFASHFTAQPVLYGYTRIRNGAAYDALGEFSPKMLNPAPANQYKGTVVCLVGQRCMSSAEWFTLMMRACGAKLVGDRTRGASGNPREVRLGNGVSYTISTWVAYDAQKQPFEDRGIAPDVVVDGKASFDGESDFVLEKALGLLSGATSTAGENTGTSSVGAEGEFDPFKKGSEPLPRDWDPTR